MSTFESPETEENLKEERKRRNKTKQSVNVNAKKEKKNARRSSSSSNSRSEGECRCCCFVVHCCSLSKLLSGSSSLTGRQCNYHHHHYGNLFSKYSVHSLTLSFFSSFPSSSSSSLLAQFVDRKVEAVEAAAAAVEVKLTTADCTFSLSCTLSLALAP